MAFPPPPQPPPLDSMETIKRRLESITSPPPLPKSSPSKNPRPEPIKLPGLDMKLLADLPRVELQARCMVEGFLSGRHRSPQKGSSVEFAEYRDYQLGDDLRRIDWALYARTDRLHVKQYQEETQLRVFLVLDISGSMDFQSTPKIMRKIEYARLVIAALGLLAQRQSDALGLALAGTELSDFLRARSSVPHWRTFIGKLDGVVASGASRLSATLESLAELIPPRSLVIIASDFYDEISDLQASLQRLHYDHHDLIGLHILDPQEIDFDFDASGIFCDLEDSNSRLRLDAPSVRKGYLARFGAFCTELDELFRLMGGETVRLRTDQVPLDALGLYLAQRKMRIR